MEQHITISRPADEVFAYLADPAHVPAWLTQLRREELHEPPPPLQVDAASRTIAWSADPEGEFRVAAVDGVTRLTLHLRSNVAAPADPTEDESPREAAGHAAMAALQSLKSHLEHADGGDPESPSPDVRSRFYGHSATQDPEI